MGGESTSIALSSNGRTIAPKTWNQAMDALQVSEYSVERAHRYLPAHLVWPWSAVPR